MCVRACVRARVRACVCVYMPTCCISSCVLVLTLVLTCRFVCMYSVYFLLLSCHTEKWASNGVITLRTAFSRDQLHKVYVQHLLEEDSDLIWDLVHNVRVCT